MKTKREIYKIKKEYGLFIEYNKEFIGKKVVASKCRAATNKEINRAFSLKRFSHKI